ncbi:hypothetical protein ACTXT7_000378 [Hymenolepis weldensis]
MRNLLRLSYEFHDFALQDGKVSPEEGSEVWLTAAHIGTAAAAIVYLLTINQLNPPTNPAMWFDDALTRIPQPQNFPGGGLSNMRVFAAPEIFTVALDKTHIASDSGLTFNSLLFSVIFSQGPSEYEWNNALPQDIDDGFSLAFAAANSSVILYTAAVTLSQCKGLDVTISFPFFAENVELGSP